jgi:hypothetical protein
MPSSPLSRWNPWPTAPPPTTRLSATDRDELEARRTAVPDEIHGRSASQLYWINPRLRHERLRPQQYLDGYQTYPLTASNLGQAMSDHLPHL